MTNMENTVRPFERVQIHPLAQYFPAPIPEGAIECKLGGSGGTTTTFTFNGQTGEVINGNRDMKETGRKATQIRVENPEDSSQYVDVCRTDSIQFKDKKEEVDPRTSSYTAPPSIYGIKTKVDSGGKSVLSNVEFSYPADQSVPPPAERKQCPTRQPEGPPTGGKC